MVQILSVKTILPNLTMKKIVAVPSFESYVMFDRSGFTLMFFFTSMFYLYVFILPN